jgi:hypothetical protein
LKIKIRFDFIEKEAAKRGETKMNVNLGDYYAYSGRFQDAARNYQHGGAPERSMTMFSDLRMFDQAKVNLLNPEKITLMLFCFRNIW